MIASVQSYKNISRTFKNTSDLFVHSLKISFPRDLIWTSFLIFILTFAVFAGLTTRSLTNGDAALFAQRIEEGILSTESVHIGYYFFGYIFTLFVPAPADYALNLMNCFLGAMSVALLSLVAYTITGKRLLSIASGLFLATNYTFVSNALYAEIYMSQFFFLLLGIQFWLMNKPVFAGLSYAIAFLITPSTIFAFPLFVILRPSKQNLIRFVLTTGIVVSLGLLPHVDNYLFTLDYKLKNERLSRLAAILKESWEIILGFFLFLPLVLVGLGEVFYEKTMRAWGSAIVSLWFISFLFGEKFGDVPVQLPTYALLCTIAAIGFDALTNTSDTSDYIARLLRLGACLLVPLLILTFNITSVLILLVFIVMIFLYILKDIFPIQFTKINIKTRGLLVIGILFVACSLNGVRMYERIKQDNEALVGYRNTILQMDRVARLNYVVIGDWHDGIRFEYYIFKQTYTGRWINTEWLVGRWGASWQEKAQAQLQSVLIARHEIWLLGDYPEIFTELRRHGYTIEPFGSIYQAEPPNL